MISTPVGVASGASFSSSPPLLASQSGSTAAQVNAIRTEITSEATRIHVLTAAYSQAASEASVLSQQLTGQRQNLVGLRQALSGAQSALRRAAVESYTGANVNDDTTDVHGSTEADIGTEFLTVASADVSNVEDSYQLAEEHVATAISRLTVEQRANTTALAAAATARSAALKTAEDEQGQLASLEDRLARLERAAAQGGPANNGLVKSTESQTGSSGSSPTATGPSSTTTTSPPSTGSPTTHPPSTSPPSTSPPTTSPRSTPPTTRPPTTTTPPTTAPSSGGGAGGVWLELRQCESGDNYRENTGNGFYGAYQFSPTTWTGLGYPGRPDLESPAMQDAAAQKLQAEAGWGQWPACSAALGLT
jgi:hypothetical protein